MVAGRRGYNSSSAMGSPARTIAPCWTSCLVMVPAAVLFTSIVVFFRLDRKDRLALLDQLTNVDKPILHFRLLNIRTQGRQNYGVCHCSLSFD